MEFVERISGGGGGGRGGIGEVKAGDDGGGVRLEVTFGGKSVTSLSLRRDTRSDMDEVLRWMLDAGCDVLAECTAAFGFNVHTVGLACPFAFNATF